MKKKVLIYGDSLVYGLVPLEHRRYNDGERWTTIMAEMLGDDWHVVEEGLRSRTLQGENPFYRERDGNKQYGPILASHLPLDLIIIMLGTNDCLEVMGKNAQQISDGLNKYLHDTVEWSKECHFKTPKLLIVSPPKINEGIANNGPRQRFRGAGEKSADLPLHYRKFAEDNNLFFYDASCIPTSEKDGVHLDLEANRNLGEALAKFISAAL